MLYKAFCFKLTVDLIAPQLGSILLEHSLWLPYLVCGIFLSFIFPLIKWMPETLHMQENLVSESNGGKDNGVRTYKSFLVREIILGLAVIFLVQLRFNMWQVLPPYTSVKFHWTLAKFSIMSQNIRLMTNLS